MKLLYVSTKENQACQSIEKIEYVGEDLIPFLYTQEMVIYLRDNDYSTIIDLEDKQYEKLNVSKFFLERTDQSGDHEKFYVEVDSTRLNRIDVTQFSEGNMQQII